MNKAPEAQEVKGEEKVPLEGWARKDGQEGQGSQGSQKSQDGPEEEKGGCLLYTSDAADE